MYSPYMYNGFTALYFLGFYCCYLYQCVCVCCVPSRWLVFGGAISALALMTVLSVCLGFATMIIPHVVTFYLSTALLALFGVKMLYDGYKMDPSEGQEELEEVTQELRIREEQVTHSKLHLHQISYHYKYL